MFQTTVFPLLLTSESVFDVRSAQNIRRLMYKMSVSDALVRLATGSFEASALTAPLPFAPLAYGTLTIPPGGFGAYTAAIPGLSTDSIFTVTLTTGTDDGAVVQWNSVVNNPTPSGPSITVGVEVAAVNAQKYCWVLWKL